MDTGGIPVESRQVQVDSYEEKAIAGLKSLTSWWWNVRP